MRCPSCGSLDTQVKDSRPTEDSSVIRRRRVCLSCNFRFTTFERVQLRELIVIKRNGRRVPFDRDKLLRSVQIALRKRPVDPERIDQMVSKIVRELESIGESEVSSETIGETVIAHLRDLDDVAYVRFASVYRNFREAKDFEAALAELSGDEAAEMSAQVSAGGRGSRQSDRRFHGARACTGPARARPHLAQSGGRRGHRRQMAATAIVGRGWTQPGGRPHAEIEALRRAGEAARGATLYVTLEPCSHHGKSPPCADAIIAARRRPRRVGAGRSKSGGCGRRSRPPARGRPRRRRRRRRR